MIQQNAPEDTDCMEQMCMKFDKPITKNDDGTFEKKDCPHFDQVNNDERISFHMNDSSIAISDDNYNETKPKNPNFITDSLLNAVYIIEKN